MSKTNKKYHRFSRRGANKHLQTKVYDYLVEHGEKTASEIAHWYNAVRETHDEYYVRGKNYGTNARQVSNIMAKSLLFEKVGETVNNGLVALWYVRPLDVVVERAIASRRPIKKYPLFLQKAILERLE
tara:strand:+ start:1026 stop:1409 length:384 start_codon:yes stop_codon:yes gene_type:complete